MNRPQEIVKDISKQFVDSMIKHDITGWPPDCLMFTYQPIRPACRENTITESEKIED